MIRRTNPIKSKLNTQMKSRVVVKSKSPEYDGNIETMISTGSTLLDLAISGGRKRGGGIPGGILVEIFGPSGSGKTVLLCELAGAVQRQGGAIMFKDPEARLNQQFAKIFDLDVSTIDYDTPDTIGDVFGSIRNWDAKNPDKINGVFADSLAALSTNLEMEKAEGDKMGTRRAKEFSEELRRTCRVLASKNYLLVASNQIRENIDAGQFGVKFKSPGGEAIGFYASLRLKFGKPERIKQKVTIAGKEVFRVIGVETTIEVFKSSVWKPYRTAPLTILFDYGIDDIRQNLQFIKTYTKNTMYMVGTTKLDKGLEASIVMVEQLKLEKKLRNEVIDLWEEIEVKFESERKSKR